jgi:hypothetical protein
MEPTVVQLKRTVRDGVVQSCTCYIGRRWCMGGWDLPKSKWWNPFSVRKVEVLLTDEERVSMARMRLKERATVKREVLMRERQRILGLYEEYVRKDPLLMGSLGELDGKTLGCWCVDVVRRPTPETLICHGEVLVKLWRERQHKAAEEEQ